jgi:hypothetical protein
MSHVISRAFAQAARRRVNHGYHWKDLLALVKERVARWEYFLTLSVWRAEGDIAQLVNNH